MPLQPSLSLSLFECSSLASFGMTENPRNREPRSFEAHLFTEIYLDETSQSGPRFLIIGGIAFPRKYSALFEQTIIAARGTRLPAFHKDGEPREIKWNTCGRGDFEAYKAVVDAFFDFRLRMEASTVNTCKFHCSIVDTHVRGRRYSVGSRGQTGFNREIYYHLLLLARSYYKKSLFHVYPDYRTSTMTMNELALILNRVLKRSKDGRDWPFRRIQFRLSNKLQALQVTDILLGALAYRINGHYDSPKANPDKKLLADYVLDRAQAYDLLRRRVVKSKNWGNYTFHLRKHRLPREDLRIK